MVAQPPDTHEALAAWRIEKPGKCMAGQTQPDYAELRQKLYGETRADLLKRQLSNSENADRAVLTVSTAALGFSLAFLKDVVPLQNAVHVWLLYGSWSLFGAAILATLASFFTSQKAIDDQLQLAYQYYMEGNDQLAQARSRFAAVTSHLNAVGAAAFACGLLGSAGFVIVNTGKEEAMNTKSKMVFDGANIPRMQALQSGTGTVALGATLPTMQMMPSTPEQRGAPVPSMQPMPAAPVAQPAQQASSPAPGESSKRN